MSELADTHLQAYHIMKAIVNMTTGRRAAFPRTCREVYQRHWRDQIDRLLQDPDDHPAALLGMVACMELAFLCKKRLPLYPKEPRKRARAQRIIEEFFPKSQFPDSSQLSDLFANGLKHNSFVRKGVGLLDTLHGQRIPEPIEREGKIVWVAPTAFWNHLQPQIEAIYAQHNCRYDTFKQ